MDLLSDEQLVCRYLKQGDEKALEDLVKRYLSQIYGYVRKYTGNPDNASDITQDVFVKAWKNLKLFDQTKSFRTWIFTIAKHTAIDWLRRKTELPLDDSFDLADDSPSVLEQLMLKEKSGKLSFAIAKLPSNYSSIINLHINEGLNFREISETIKVPLNTVKSRYHRGLALLKRIV